VRLITDEKHMKIAEFLGPENVMIDLAPKSKNMILQIMSARASRTLGITESSILHALLNREKFGSTGVGEGIAIPHTRVPGVKAPFGMLARLSTAIDFDAIDDVPVDLVFLLLMPVEGDNKDHLNVLACVARRLRSQETVGNIRNAGSVDEVYEAMIHEPPAEVNR
jgi:PTS system nitrogen regulatory IIA component